MSGQTQRASNRKLQTGTDDVSDLRQGVATNRGAPQALASYPNLGAKGRRGERRVWDASTSQF